MSLSKDGLTGHPTKEDPNPAERKAGFLGWNKWPKSAEDKEREEEKASRTMSEQRRVQIAEQNRERARRNARLKELLEIYDVPRPVKVPGQRRELFSRYCKDAGCEVSKFADLDTFVAHVVEQHGDPEKDKRLSDLDDRIEGDREERLAENTADALEETAGPPGSDPGGGTPAGEPPPVHVPMFEVLPDQEA